MVLVVCPNCNKQAESDGTYGEKCYWCNGFLRKYEDKPRTEVKPINPVPAPEETPKKTGKGGGSANMERKNYYLSHKHEIIVTFLTQGFTGLILQWGIGKSTWQQETGLRNRWHEDIVKIAAEMNIPYSKDWKLGKINKQTQEIKNKPVKFTKETVDNIPEYWKGYRQAILDISGKG